MWLTRAHPLLPVTFNSSLSYIGPWLSNRVNTHVSLDHSGVNGFQPSCKLRSTSRILLRFAHGLALIQSVLQIYQPHLSHEGMGPTRNRHAIEKLTFRVMREEHATWICEEIDGILHVDRINLSKLGLVPKDKEWRILN